MKGYFPYKLIRNINDRHHRRAELSVAFLNVPPKLIDIVSDCRTSQRLSSSICTCSSCSMVPRSLCYTYPTLELTESKQDPFKFKFLCSSSREKGLPLFLPHPLSLSLSLFLGRALTSFCAMLCGRSFPGWNPPPPPPPPPQTATRAVRRGESVKPEEEEEEHTQH